MPKKKTQEQCIEGFRRVHGDKYNYSEVKYKGDKIAVNIICRIHGIFQQTPHDHLSGCGCRKCFYESKRITTDDFISKAKIIHKDKYIYTKTNLEERNGKNDDIIITCPTHGDFTISVREHLNGRGCSKCAGNYHLKTNEFIDIANKIHKNKYNYDKTDTNKRDEKGRIIITCPIHGDFKQTIRGHLKGQGCKKCYVESLKMTTEEFIEKAINVHNNTFLYNKTDLDKKDEKGRVIITCKEHGDFLQFPNNHLHGYGCPYCKISHMENEIRDILEKNQINCFQQKHFGWLGWQSLDFYLPKYNIGIECQGIQHFESVEYFGGNEKLQRQKEMDNKKMKLCEENGVKLLYYSNLNIKFPYEVYTDKEKLIEDILKQKKKAV